MTYAGFWRRALAIVVDLAVWVFISAAYFVMLRFSIPVAIIALLLINVLGIAYPVYFLARWGQTLGKMVARIKVTRLDGTPIEAKQAWLRSSVDIALIAVYLPFAIYMLVTWTGPDWSSLTWANRGAEMDARNPASDAHLWLSQIWLWSELVVLLLNKKRRALHDFIAGTVVVKIDRAAAKAS